MKRTIIVLTVLATTALIASSCGEKEVRDTPDNDITTAVRTWPEGALQGREDTLLYQGDDEPFDTLNILKKWFVIYYPPEMSREEFMSKLPSNFVNRPLGYSLPEDGVFLALSETEWHEAIEQLKQIDCIYAIDHMYSGLDRYPETTGVTFRPYRLKCFTTTTTDPSIRQADSIRILRVADSLHLVLTSTYQSSSAQPYRYSALVFTADHALVTALTAANIMRERLDLPTFPEKGTYFLDR